MGDDNERKTLKSTIQSYQANDAASRAFAVDVGMQKQARREAVCGRHEPDDDDPLFCRHCGALAPDSGLRVWPKVQDASKAKT